MGNSCDKPSLSSEPIKKLNNKKPDAMIDYENEQDDNLDALKTSEISVTSNQRSKRPIKMITKPLGNEKDEKSPVHQLLSVQNDLGDEEETLSNVEEHMIFRAIKKSRHCFVEENLDRLKVKQRYNRDLLQVLKESSPVKAVRARSKLVEENRDMLLNLYLRGSEEPDTADTENEEVPKVSYTKEYKVHYEGKRMEDVGNRLISGQETKEDAARIVQILPGETEDL